MLTVSLTTAVTIPFHSVSSELRKTRGVSCHIAWGKIIIVKHQPKNLVIGPCGFRAHGAEP